MPVQRTAALDEALAIATLGKWLLRACLFKSGHLSRKLYVQKALNLWTLGLLEVVYWNRLL